MLIQCGIADGLSSVLDGGGGGEGEGADYNADARIFLLLMYCWRSHILNVVTATSTLVTE